MRFRLLGGLGVEGGDGQPIDLGGPKQRAVLASLLLALGRPVSAEQLQEQVWGDQVPANPETSLQAYVSNLRRALEPDRRPREAPQVLVTRPAGYALLVPRDRLDTTAFEDDAREAQAILDRDPRGARALLDAALDRWTGPLLPELAGEPWVDAHNTWLSGLHRQALLARFDAGLALGEHAGLVPRIEQALADHPFEEHLHAQLALALYRSGRQRDALAALASAGAVLREEVGVEPGPELRGLEARILDQDPTLDLAATPAPVATAPGPTPRRRATDRDGSSREEEPASERDGAAGRFVGRDAELAALVEAARLAATGGGRPVVVSGEPGIGKTRLVEEAISRLPGTTVVAWGRCPESAASAAYWPCIQIGRQLEGAGVLPTELAAEVLPEEDVQAPVSDDAAAERLGLHVAVVKMLAAVDHPLVLVVDDLQWADGASLRVIEFVTGELRSTNVLLVVTVRPTPPDAPMPLVDCLGELARQPGAVRIDLAGLSDAAVGTWLAERTHRPASPEVAHAIRDRTGGNPFFVSEVVELLAADGGAVDLDGLRRWSAVPAAVQDVVRRRVSRLPRASQQLLSAASVLGRTFDLDVLAAVLEDTIPSLLDHIEPALDAGLIVDTDIPGRFEFSHALVAETLAAEVGPTRRARLHAAAARALATVRASDLDGHLAELAHHAVEGAIAGTAEEAYRWSTLAARQATLRLAHEEAADHWSHAARALELARPGDADARYEALREEGLAWLRVDAIDPGYAALVRALELVLGLGDLPKVAQAAADMSIDSAWGTSEVSLTSVDAMAALERALDALPDTPTLERVSATGALAEISYWIRPPEVLDALTTRAVADARTLGDLPTLGRALHKRDQALWRAASLETRAAAAEELFAMAEEHDLPPSLEAIARVGMAGVYWERAQVGIAVEQAARAQRLAHELGSPALMTQIDWFSASMAGFRGRLREAEALCDRAYELYRRTRRWSADTLDSALRMSVLMEQDRLEEIRSRSGALLDSPYRPWFQEGYAYGLVQFGLLDEAAEVLADAPLPPLDDCWLFLGLLGAAIHVRVALGDRAAVATLVEVLAPYEGRLAVAGTGSAFGDVHLALAAGHAFLDHDELARSHIHRSVGVLEAAGAAPDLVRALLLRAEIAPEGAEADLAQARRLVHDVDLPLLRRRLE